MMINDISYKNLVTKEWRDIYILHQFLWGHNQTTKVACYIQRIAYNSSLTPCKN